MAVITKKELIDRISDSSGARRVQVKRVVQQFLDEIVEELRRGNRLEFRDFGVFETKLRKARKAQDPKSLESAAVSEKRTVKFKVCRLVKQSLAAPTGSLIGDEAGDASDVSERMQRPTIKASKANAMTEVYDFFQESSESARRQQVQWAQRNLNLQTAFFSKFLNVDKGHFIDWLTGSESLSPADLEHLADFWRTILHLLSFMGSDPMKLRQLLVHSVPDGPPTAIRLPAWKGTSLLKFLEQNGPAATTVVDEFVSAFRFGDVYVS